MNARLLKTRLGDVIRKKRLALDISQEALAANIGIHRNYIGSIERGERQFSIDILLKIALGLKTKASALLEECGV
jgi:transcriptional regulator with XRE-family HTH domain